MIERDNSKEDVVAHSIVVAVVVGEVVAASNVSQRDQIYLETEPVWVGKGNKNGNGKGRTMEGLKNHIEVHI